MTDYKQLKQLLTSFGIPFTEENNTILLTVDKEVIQGYTSFETEFKFSEDGTFKSVGIWE